MKFKVLNTEPPEQTLRCTICGALFSTDPSIQMNLVLINNVLLAQCPKCKTIEDEPDFKKEAKINIKDCTKTVDGTPVRIYATDGGDEFPIHGAIFDPSKGYWEAEAWTKEGKFLLTGDHDLDLDLSDWKDEIPWDCLRPEIKWVARDEDKYWYGFDEYPSLKITTWEAEEIGGEYSSEAVNMPKGPLDWKEAIARRPK